MGNKLQDSDINKKWYRAFRAVQQDFFNFIKSNYPDILTWTGDIADAEGQYKGFLGGTISAPVKADAPVEEKKPEPVKKAAPVVKKEPAKKEPSKV